MSTVTAITPNFGAVGDSVTITGSGFGAAQGGSTVTFGGVAVATYTSWSDTSLVVVVPAATASGRVVVTVSGAVQADYKASWFELRDATVISIYDAINGRIKAQDETADSSPEDYRYADARDYNNLTHLFANILEGTKPIAGARVSYVSATAIAIAAGSMMSSDGKYLLSPAASTSVAITTAAAISGLDETTCAATATTSGASATVTMTASLWVETPMTNTVRTGTGTITGAGTTITGTSTLFLSELAVGDVIRSTSTGAARVTAIASDTSLTIAAAFPGGSPAGSGFTFYEGLTFQPNTAVAADKFRINTVTHAGTTIVMSAAISSGAGGSKVAKVGVEVAACWYFPWAVYGASGHGYILSTQRTRPYGVTGYTTAWRLVGGVYNNSSGDIDYFASEQRGSSKVFTIPRTYIANAVASGTLARYAWEPVLPPIAEWCIAEMQAIRAKAQASDTQANIRASLDGTNPYFYAGAGSVDNTIHGTQALSYAEIPKSVTGRATYVATDDANTTGYISAIGWSFTP